MNCIVATQVGEEGLDIGNVDLIVCFDALKSPIRMIQRMGRTARFRNGKVIIFIQEGEEEEKIHRSKLNSQVITNKLKAISNNAFKLK